MVLAQKLKEMNKKISFLGLLDARIGPSPLYRWYFKQIDQKILRHFYLSKLVNKNETKNESIGSLLFHGIGRRIGLIKKPEWTESTEIRIPLKSYEPPFHVPHYNDSIWLFRASGHPLRNLLFPRAGFSKNSYPQLKIATMTGNHYTVLTEFENLTRVGKEISKVMEKQVI
jgi:hypothetical protein